MLLSMCIEHMYKVGDKGDGFVHIYRNLNVNDWMVFVFVTLSFLRDLACYFTTYQFECRCTQKRTSKLGICRHRVYS